MARVFGGEGDVVVDRYPAVRIGGQGTAPAGITADPVQEQGASDVAYSLRRDMAELAPRSGPSFGDTRRRLAANNRLSGQSRDGTVADVRQHRTFVMMRPLPGPVSHAPL